MSSFLPDQASLGAMNAYKLDKDWDGLTKQVWHGWWLGPIGNVILESIN